MNYLQSEDYEVMRLDLKSIFTRKHCCFCHKASFAFLPIGYQCELFTNTPVIGAGRRFGRCPNCGSSDRERWQLYVISHYTNMLTNDVRVLHFAPEPNLSKHVRMNKHCQYCSADIVEGVADCVVDMTDMPFEDESFDFIIANHVLEHISDEAAAISEMKRCIKPSGKIILSFPICLSMDTFETEKAVSDEDRIRYYGQKDHCRLYGRDYCQRLSKYGLNITTYSPKDILRKSQIKRNGYIENDVMLLCTKQAAIADELSKDRSI